LGECIAKIEILGVKLKIDSYFEECIAKIKTLEIELKISSNFGGWVKCTFPMKLRLRVYLGCDFKKCI
jgi:hypothetical protein